MHEGGTTVTHLHEILQVIKLREALGVNSGEKMLLSVGELSKRKNHEVVIKSINKLNRERRIDTVKYFVAGDGDLQEYLSNLIEDSHLQDKVFLLGYRTDVNMLTKAADVFVLPSRQEGLSVALMEAMATGLPVLCSKIRGNTDLVRNEYNGFTYKVDDVDGFSAGIEKIIHTSYKIGANNLISVKKYDEAVVKNIMKNVYTNILKEN